MANCDNCGAKLNAFNTIYTFDYVEYGKFCSHCNARFNRFLNDNGISHSSKLNKEFLADHENELVDLGFTDDGIRKINTYVDSLKQKAENEAADEKRAADIKVAEEKRAAEEKERIEQALRTIDERKQAFIETTGFSVDGYKIVKHLGIKSGEVVLGTGFLSELSAGINDIFGTASNTMAAKLTTAKNVALEKLRDNCLNIGANAVIGVDIDISIIGQNMILACANGTAVILRKIDEQGNA